MELILNLAFILTHNRLELLRRCVNQIIPQIDYLLVIDNASSPPVKAPDIFSVLDICSMGLMHIPDQPPNLASLMNIGFDWAEHKARKHNYVKWNIACLCDDVNVPDRWYDAVSTCIRTTGAIAGSTHQISPTITSIVKMTPDSDIYNRMQGSACIFKGEAGLRADERMHWWWQDTDLDWQARKAGGMVIAPGPVAANSLPNDFTYSVPGLSERAGQDGLVFKNKWGFLPW